MPEKKTEQGEQHRVIAGKNNEEREKKGRAELVFVAARGEGGKTWPHTF